MSKLTETAALISQQFGKGSVMMLTDAPVNHPVILTGSPALDVALGGGYPKGRIVEVYGPERSGKTTLALHAIHEVQKTGGCAAFIDANHGLDIAYARAIGVDVSRLLISQPDNGEQALEIVESLVRSGAVDIAVIDSVAGLTPKSEIEGDVDPFNGAHARLMSQALRKVTAVAHRTGTTILFTNDLRQKTGVTFGNPETTTGGNALKFYASVRIDTRRIETVLPVVAEPARLDPNGTEQPKTRIVHHPPENACFGRAADIQIRDGSGIVDR